MPFSLTTYNVLAQAYITPTRYPRTPGPVLASVWRRPALVRHIVALGTDVVCLQEVEDETFAAVQQALGPLGYTGHFAKKGGGKPDGCATFVRQNTLAWGTIHPLVYSDGAGTERDSGHLALVVLCAYKGRPLGLAGCEAWLICGDLNVTPASHVVAVLRGEGFDYTHRTLAGTYTCNASARANMLDYVFYTEAFRVQPVAVPVIDDQTPLPSYDQPSDHLALMAHFDWH